MTDETGWIAMAAVMHFHLDRINAAFDSLFTGAEEVGTGDTVTDGFGEG